MHEARGRPRIHAARRDRRADRGVLVLALLLSALLHVLAFAVLSFRIPTEPRVSIAPSRIVNVVPAMQVYDIVEVASDVPTIEVLIVEREMLRPQPVRVTPPSGAEAAAADDVAAAPEPVDSTSVRDRLRYRLNAPQVWRPPSAEIVVDEPSPKDIVAQRIASQLGEFNDSVAAEAAAAERALDWTTKDADGNRWGVSPGAIHLGGITIPIGNTAFAVAAGRREEFAGRVRTWNEIQDQAVREEAKGEFKDRVKAIEERMNRERAARRTPATTTTRGDTTGTGRNNRGN
jgi:hypothetical protein